MCPLQLSTDDQTEQISAKNHNLVKQNYDITLQINKLGVFPCAKKTNPFHSHPGKTITHLTRDITGPTRLTVANLAWQ